MPESLNEIKRKIAEAKRLGAIVVNRQQVTSGQLDTAILLWFLEIDPISTCTLVSAALIVLSSRRKQDWEIVPHFQQGNGEASRKEIKNGS